MAWWIIFIMAAIVTVLTKGYTSLMLERLRNELSLKSREARNAKGRLVDARQTQENVVNENRGKEVLLSRLKRDVGELKEKVASLQAAHQKALKDQERSDGSRLRL